jgi:hypothetical protein
VNGNNSIEEEVKGRISLGNKTFKQIKIYSKVNCCPRKPSYGCTKH